MIVSWSITDVNSFYSPILVPFNGTDESKADSGGKGDQSVVLSHIDLNKTQLWINK